MTDSSSNETAGLDNSSDLGNIKSGHQFDLGNGRKEIAKVAASFRGAYGRGYPYVFHLPYLSGLEAGIEGRLQSYNTLSNPPEPTMTPKARQAQNLNRTPARSNITESWPVLIVVGALAILVLSVGIHLSTGGTLDIGGR
jgi:hypothetical protein